MNARLSSYLISVVILMVIVLGGIQVFYGFSAYDSTLQTSELAQFNKTFNQSSQLTDNIQDISDTISSSEANSGTFGVLGGIIEVSWGVLKNVFNSFGFIHDIFVAVAAYLFIPPWVVDTLFLIIILVIAFSIWGAVFQKDL